MLELFMLLIAKHILEKLGSMDDYTGTERKKCTDREVMWEYHNLIVFMVLYMPIAGILIWLYTIIYMKYVNLQPQWYLMECLSPMLCLECTVDMKMASFQRNARLKTQKMMTIEP